MTDEQGMGLVGQGNEKAPASGEPGPDLDAVQRIARATCAQMYKAHRESGYLVRNKKDPGQYRRGRYGRSSSRPSRQASFRRCPMNDRREWLGHRDLCPVAWGEDCDCFCSDKSCDGVLNCEDPACPIAAYLKTQ